MFRYKFLCLIPALVHRRWREVLAALLHPHRVWRRPAGAGGGAGVGGGGGSRRRRTTTWSSARSWSRALLAARTRERSKMHGTSASQRKRGAQLGQKQEARGLHRCRAFDAHNVICAVVSWHSARPPTARCCRGSGDARLRPLSLKRGRPLVRLAQRSHGVLHKETRPDQDTSAAAAAVVPGRAKLNGLFLENQNTS